MKSIDDYAYYSTIHFTDTGAKVIFAFVPLLFVFIANSAVINIIVFSIMSYYIIKYASLSYKILIKFYSVPAIFTILGVIAIIINASVDYSELIFGLKVGEYYYGVSYSGLHGGLKLITRVFAAVSCLYFIAFNTPMNAVLSFLERIKMPSVFITLAELIYRYTFLLFDEAYRIRRAQRSRLGYNSFIRSIKSLGLLSASVFIGAYVRSENIYNALISRGYTGSFTLIDTRCESGKFLYVRLAFIFLVLCIVEITDIVWL